MRSLNNRLESVFEIAQYDNNTSLLKFLCDFEASQESRLKLWKLVYDVYYTGLDDLFDNHVYGLDKALSLD